MNGKKVNGIPSLKHITALVLVTLLACVCALTVSAEAEQPQARNIAGQCEYKATSFAGEFECLTNGYLSAALRVRGQGQQYLSVDLKGNEASFIYVKWGEYAPLWTLEATLADGSVVSTRQGQHGFIQEYAELPQGTVRFRMITEDGKTYPMQIVELEIYSTGTRPDSVHIWSPTPTTAEIMFISTHQDDEILYFGGGIPYYAGERDLDSVVVYTAYDNYLRLHEALEGLWVCGERQHPVFMHYPDAYSISIEGARDTWFQNDVVRSITEQIVKYRPQVIITQDEDGEYGHGQHLLTVFCVKEALKQAESIEYLNKELPGYEPWSVSKCYLHLYPHNKISMPWDKLIMESNGGKSTYQAAVEAYDCHRSQHIFKEYSVSFTEYDCRAFGLYRTTVGEDINKNDFLENITLRYEHVQPPDDAVTDLMERVNAKGWLYRCRDKIGTAEEYIRYCMVGGISGWYLADHTGCLTTPATCITVVRDEIITDLSEYVNLTLISQLPQLFEYSDGQGSGVIVRYCAVGDGLSAFYLAEADGSLVQPITRIDVPMRRPIFQQWQEGGQQVRATDVVLLCIFGLMICTSIALCFAVMNLSSKKKMRRRRRR